MTQFLFRAHGEGFGDGTWLPGELLGLDREKDVLAIPSVHRSREAFDLFNP